MRRQCHLKKGGLLLKIPRVKGHTILCRATWGNITVSQEAEEVRGRPEPEHLLGFSEGISEAE